jgi:hypothetical protein
MQQVYSLIYIMILSSKQQIFLELYLPSNPLVIISGNAVIYTVPPPQYLALQFKP